MTGRLVASLLLVVIAVVIFSNGGGLFQSQEPMMVPAGSGGVDSESVRHHTPAPEKSPPPVSNTNAVSPGSESDPPQRVADINRSQKATLVTLLSGFYEKLNRSDQYRRRVTIEAATKICRETERIDTASAMMANSSYAHDAVRHLDYSVQIVNEHFNDQLQRGTFQRMRGSAQSISQYAPIYGSFNSMRADACAVANQRSNESIEDFYISTAAFGVEAGMVQFGFYKTAFEGTRKIVNTVGLAKLRSICGDRCYALAMSEIHWAIRGAPIEFTEFLRDHLRQTDFSIDVTKNMTDYIVEHQGLQYARQTVVACSQQIGGDSADAGGEILKVGGEMVDEVASANVSKESIAEGVTGIVNEGANTSLSDIQEGVETAGDITLDTLSDVEPTKIYDSAKDYFGQCSR